MHLKTDLDPSDHRLDPESDPAAPRLHSFYFGDWTLRGSPRTLEHCGESVPLQPQALQVLEELLHSVGEVVERDKLRKKLFADRPFLDHRQAINRAVSQLRRALGDSARTPRFIETVGSRGYRFIAPTAVESIPLARPASGGEESQEPQAFPRRSRAWMVAALVPALLALVWVSTGSRFESLRGPAGASLQFADWSTAGTPSSARARSLATTLARELSAEVFVAEPPGWRIFAEWTETDETPDRRVEGTLRLQSDDRAVITLQLIDAAGQLQWVRSDSVEVSRLDSWLELSATELVEALGPGQDPPS